jgi:hypothetical protein
MADRAEHPWPDSALRTSGPADPDAHRRSRAEARVLMLDELERCLLELAVQAADDTAARWLEGWADAAYCDAAALRAEHGLDAEEGP